MFPPNDREEYDFMCIETGKFRHSNNWTSKPVTEEVIQQVENIAKDMVNEQSLLDEMDTYYDTELMNNAIR